MESLELPGIEILTSKGTEKDLAQKLTSTVVLAAFQRTENGSDKSLLRIAMIGYDHLRSAALAQAESLRERELLLARTRFSDLRYFDPTQTALRRAFAIYLPKRSNSPVGPICAGFHGSYCYFSMSNDLEQALSCVYECVLRFPLEAFRFFPEIGRFFAKDYASSLNCLSDQQQAILRKSEKFALHDQEERRISPFFLDYLQTNEKMRDLLTELRQECIDRLNGLLRGLDDGTQGLVNLRQGLKLNGT